MGETGERLARESEASVSRHEWDEEDELDEGDVCDYPCFACGESNVATHDEALCLACAERFCEGCSKVSSRKLCECGRCDMCHEEETCP